MQGFTRLWERIRETLREDLWGFARLWERGFGRGFTSIQGFTRNCKTLGDFGRICKICKRISRIRDFGRGFARICKTLGEDLQHFKDLQETLGEGISQVRLQGFVRLWERFARFVREDLHKILAEDSQVFARIWERIRKELQDFGRGFARIC